MPSPSSGSPVSESTAASTNPAVARCCATWQRRFDAEIAKGVKRGIASYFADQSFRDALPALSDYESIRDFIACTAYGMLTDKIPSPKGTQLLYAAQVALSSLRFNPSKEKAPKKQQQVSS